VFLELDKGDGVLEISSLLYLQGDLEAQEFGYFLGSTTFSSQGMQQNYTKPG